MKSIHHIIVAAMDSGMPEYESAELATELLAESDVIASLAERIERTDAEQQRLANYRKALESIRDKWAIHGAATPYANAEDRAAVPPTVTADQEPEHRLRS